MSAEVGRIYFRFTIKHNIEKQLKDISAKAQAPAKKAGEELVKAVSEPVAKQGEKIGDTLIKPMRDAVKKSKPSIIKQVKDIGNLAKKFLSSSLTGATGKVKETPEKFTGKIKNNEPAPQNQKQADTLSQRLARQSEAVKKQEIAVKGLSQEYKKLSSDINFSAEFFNVESKLLDAQRQVKQLGNALKRALKADNDTAAMQLDKQFTKAYDEAEKLKSQLKELKIAPNTSEETKKLKDNLELATQKLERLKNEADSTKVSLDKALEPGPPEKFTDKLKVAAAGFGKLGSTANKMKGVAGKALKSVSSGLKKMTGRITGGAKKLSNNISRAFRSVFLMAGIYAAFKGVRSLFQDAIANNEEFSNSLKVIKANLQVAFTPIMQAIQPALNMLASGFAAVSKQIATISANLFGQTYQQAVASTKKIKDVSKEAKKTKGALAGIDDLNVLGGTGDQEQEKGQSNIDVLDNAKYGEVEGFGTKVKDMLVGLASGVGPLISNVISKIAEHIPKFVSAAVEVIQALLRGLNENAPQIIAAVPVIINSLLDGLEALLPELSEFAINVIEFMVTAFLTLAPRLITIGISLLASILTGLAKKIPDLIPMAQDAIRTIMDVITKHLPTILQAGIDIILSLIDGIVEMIPELIPMAVECILTIVDALLNNLDKIIDTAIDLILAIVEGILLALPKILEAAPKIISKLIEGILNAIPQLIQAAIDIVIALVKFLTDPNTLISLIMAAPKIIIALIKGLISAIPQLILAIPEIIFAIVDTLLNTDWLQVGKDILKGIGDGLIQGVKNIWNTIKDVGNKIKDGFKSIFKIKSPSRLFRDEIGENLALGIGVGFEDEMPDVMKDIEKALPASLPIPAPELSMLPNTARPTQTAYQETFGASAFASDNQDINITSNIYTDDGIFAGTTKQRISRQGRSWGVPAMQGG